MSEVDILIENYKLGNKVHRYDFGVLCGEIARLRERVVELASALGKAESDCAHMEIERDEARAEADEIARLRERVREVLRERDAMATQLDETAEERAQAWSDCRKAERERDEARAALQRIADDDHPDGYLCMRCAALRAREDEGDE